MLDELKERFGQDAVSYIWFLKGQTLLINGKPGAIADGLAEFARGLDLLRDESPAAVWYDSAVQEASEWLQIIAEHPDYSDAVSELQEEYAFLLDSFPFDGSPIDGSPIGDLIDRARIESYWRAINRIPGDALALGVGNSLTADVGLDEDLWFYFVAPQSQVYALQAGSSDSSFDPVIAVFSVVGDDELEFLQFNDDEESSLDAGLSIGLEQGVRYYVGVSDLYGRPGSASLSVE